MLRFFYDTSAFAKAYHPETGSARVAALLTTARAGHTISRLGFMEFHSLSARRCRTGRLSPAEFNTVSRRFRRDVTAKRFRLVRVTVPHFQLAERLISRIGLTQNLRTLDALQLAVALNLNDPADSITFVSADQALCTIADAEGLAVVNPELP